MNALAIHLAAGSHTFDNFLTWVTAFRVAEMRRFQASFVRNLLFTEVVSKPRHALHEPKSVEGGVAHRASTRSASPFEKKTPKRLQVGTLNQEVGGDRSSRRSPNDSVGNFADMCVSSNKIGQCVEIDAGELAHERRSCRSLESQSSEVRRLVGDG